MNMVLTGNVQLGGGVPGRPGPTTGLDLRGGAIPRSKRGELRGHHQWETDPNNQRIYPALHPGALTRFEGGPNMLPRPRSHIYRRNQQQHRKIPEPVQPAGC